MNDVTTWRAEMEYERRDTGDDSPIVAVAPSEDVLDIAFDGGYGYAQGPAVLVWTEERVYFPVTYDGRETLRPAPRNPTAEGQAHVGGE